MFHLSRPAYMEEALAKRGSFPLMVELLKLAILHPILYLLVLKLFRFIVSRPSASALPPQASIAISLTCSGLLGFLFLIPLRLLDGRDLKAIGFTGAGQCPGALLKGAALSLLFFLSTILAAVALGAARFSAVDPASLPAALLLLPPVFFQSLGEEVEFRGCFLTNVSGRVTPWAAILLNGLAFGAAHLHSGKVSPMAFLNTALVSVVLCVLIFRTGSIWASASFHAVWNYAQGFLFGLPISGRPAGGLLQFTLAEGKPLLTGGTYGMEASVITTAALVLAVPVILWLTRDRSANA